MAARYQHITDPVGADITRRIDGLIWERDDDDPAKVSHTK
jgi:hypothetical protein